MANKNQPTSLVLEQCYQHIQNFAFARSNSEKIGLEQEMLAVRGEQTVPLSDLQEVLKELPVQPVYDGDVIVSFQWSEDPDAGALTFEPGGQLEIATAPESSLNHAFQRMKNLQERLDSCLGRHDIHLEQLGANPWETVEEIGLRLAKPRYRAMDQYFQSIGPWGRVMMRQTMTLQVCLDFGRSDETLVQRYLAAQLIAPFAAASFANSPYLNNQKANQIGSRIRAWCELDGSRTGFPGIENMLKEPQYDTCIRAYCDGALDAQVIYIKSKDFDIPTGKFSFRDWVMHGWKGTYPTLEDLDIHISLMFPEVRPKGFLELRSVDAQIRSLQGVPPAFYFGLIYDQQNVEKILEYFVPKGVKNLKENILKATHGLREIDHQDVIKIWNWSIEGLSRLGEDYGKFLVEEFADYYVLKKKTPADDFLDRVGDNRVTKATIDLWNDWWSRRLERGANDQ